MPATSTCPGSFEVLRLHVADLGRPDLHDPQGGNDAGDGEAHPRAREPAVSAGGRGGRGRRRTGHLSHDLGAAAWVAVLPARCSRGRRSSQPAGQRGVVGGAGLSSIARGPGHGSHSDDGGLGVAADGRHAVHGGKRAPTGRPLRDIDGALDSRLALAGSGRPGPATRAAGSGEGGVSRDRASRNRSRRRASNTFLDGGSGWARVRPAHQVCPRRSLIRCRTVPAPAQGLQLAASSGILAVGLAPVPRRTRRHHRLHPQCRIGQHGRHGGATVCSHASEGRPSATPLRRRTPRARSSVTASMP